MINDNSVTLTAGTVQQRRQALIHFIWGAGGFPTGLPAHVARNVPSPVPGLPDLERADNLTFTMEGGVTNIAHHFIPKHKLNRLVIVHHGHACTFVDLPPDPTSDAGYGMQRTVAALLKEGYSVLACYMPSYHDPLSCGTPSHDSLFGRTVAAGSPMKWFLEHVAVALNYLKSKAANDGFPHYEDYSMLGLSGGGWTTTVYAAIDPTIKLSIPIAGSIPIYLRSGGSLGDTEQVLEAFYSIAGYPDLYTLGAYGPDRRQVWLLNRRDDCCFGQGQHDANAHGEWDAAMRKTEGQVRTALYQMGANGFFRLEIDETSTHHEISWNAVANVILPELNDGRRIIGVASSQNAFVRGLDGNLWRWSASGGWSTTGLPMVGTPAVLEGAIHPIDVFYRAPSQNAMMHAWWDGGAWHSEAMGGGSITDPVATSPVPNRIHVVGIGGDYRSYLWSLPGAGFVQFGTQRVFGQPALTNGANALNFYMRAPDRSLWHLQSNSAANPTKWSEERLGGEVTDFPSALPTSRGIDRVYLRGANTDHLWEVERPNAGAWVWTDLCAKISADRVSGSPSASRSAGGEIRVHVRDGGGNLERFDLYGTWAAQKVATHLSGSPVAVTDGGCFVRGASGHLWRFTGDEWENLGGLFY